ncbi:triacylglycerol lipase 2-like [Chenopodium quinoa]|uniref:triacylglycerol lipase 2-like n=1 Tax=Chenopodium quinoa TaxID=63459 RepID=UPI000B794099|nr:triacylglycerol lipase 2-like [Chenopodium quinoa]
MQKLHRLRTLKSSIWRLVGMPELKKRASNTVSAVQDTYFSTKDTFERHKVVFTVGTSIASVGTAWLGYTFRHVHDTRVDRRLDSIEQALMYWSGLHEFVPRGQAVKKLLTDIYRKQGIDCTDFLTSFTGVNCCLSTATVSTFLQHEPQPTATKNMIHFSQMARDGTIARYDYLDPDKNLERYGQTKPPEYDLTNIPNNLPMFIAHGGRDELADVDDVKFLLDKLKNHDKDKLFLQFVEDYAHADYVLAMNAKEIVYDLLIDFFNKHSKS